MSTKKAIPCRNGPYCLTSLCRCRHTIKRERSESLPVKEEEVEPEFAPTTIKREELSLEEDSDALMEYLDDIERMLGVGPVHEEPDEEEDAVKSEDMASETPSIHKNQDATASSAGQASEEVEVTEALNSEKPAWQESEEHFAEMGFFLREGTDDGYVYEALDPRFRVGYTAWDEGKCLT